MSFQNKSTIKHTLNVKDQISLFFCCSGLRERGCKTKHNRAHTHSPREHPKQRVFSSKGCTLAEIVGTRKQAQICFLNCLVPGTCWCAGLTPKLPSASGLRTFVHTYQPAPLVGTEKGGDCLCGEKLPLTCQRPAEPQA